MSQSERIADLEVDVANGCDTVTFGPATAVLHSLVLYIPEMSSSILYVAAAVAVARPGGSQTEMTQPINPYVAASRLDSSHKTCAAGSSSLHLYRVVCPP
jgi:hypothetical protein